MSDRSDFYYEQEVTQAEMDQAFSDMENADRNLIADQTNIVDGNAVWGVYHGYLVSQTATPSLSVEITDGVAYDDLGQRIPHSGGPYTLDLTSYQPGSDQRYVRIYAEFTRVLSDPRTDGLGSPVDYRQTESVNFVVDAGAISASPVKPAVLFPEKVLLATVLLVNGLLIQDARISMVEPSIADPTGDRQPGGPLFAHGRLQDVSRALLYQSGSNDVINLNGNNLLTGGGNVNMGTGDISRAGHVDAEGDPSSLGEQGFRYVVPATGALKDVQKWLSWDATTFFPMAHISQGDVYTVADNSWYMESDAGGPFPWAEHVGRWRHTMSAPGANYSQGLAVPLTGLPLLCRLDSVEFGVDIHTVVDADMRFGVMVYRRGRVADDSADLMNDSGTVTFAAVGSTGLAWINNDTIDGLKDIIDPEHYAYYACFFVWSTVARSSIDIGLKVSYARAAYTIREASGVY